VAVDQGRLDALQASVLEMVADLWDRAFPIPPADHQFDGLLEILNGKVSPLAG
jgi:hypothetical protein